MFNVLASDESLHTGPRSPRRRNYLKNIIPKCRLVDTTTVRHKKSRGPKALRYINAKMNLDSFFNRMWQRVALGSAIPIDRDLRLAVEDHDGFVVLEFPCRYVGDGCWADAKTRRLVDV